MLHDDDDDDDEVLDTLDDVPLVPAAARRDALEEPTVSDAARARGPVVRSWDTLCDALGASDESITRLETQIAALLENAFGAVTTLDATVLLGDIRLHWANAIGKLCVGVMRGPDEAPSGNRNRLPPAFVPCVLPVDGMVRDSLRVLEIHGVGPVSRTDDRGMFPRGVVAVPTLAAPERLFAQQAGQQAVIDLRTVVVRAALVDALGRVPNVHTLRLVDCLFTETATLVVGATLHELVLDGVVLWDATIYVNHANAVGLRLLTIRSKHTYVSELAAGGPPVAFANRVGAFTLLPCPRQLELVEYCLALHPSTLAELATLDPTPSLLAVKVDGRSRYTVAAPFRAMAAAGSAVNLSLAPLRQEPPSGWAAGVNQGARLVQRIMAQQTRDVAGLVMLDHHLAAYVGIAHAGGAGVDTTPFVGCARADGRPLGRFNQQRVRAPTIVVALPAAVDPAALLRPVCGISYYRELWLIIGDGRRGGCRATPVAALYEKTRDFDFALDPPPSMGVALGDFPLQQTHMCYAVYPSPHVELHMPSGTVNATSREGCDLLARWAAAVAAWSGGPPRRGWLACFVPWRR